MKKRQPQAPQGRRKDRSSARRSASHNGRQKSAGHTAHERPSSSQRARTRSAERPDAGIIEGRRAAIEALDMGVPIKRALVQARQDDDRSLEGLVGRLEEAGVTVERVEHSRLDSLSSHGAHQGIILQVRPFAYAELSDIIKKSGTSSALVVVLDHVTDEGNFGAIVRSAEIVGASGVIIANARAASVGTAAYKTSAGAVLHLPIARVANLSRALDDLKKAGFWVGGASEHAQDDIWSAPIEGRLCLVMGSEGSGISRLIQQKCDFLCRIPQRGAIESLNVAQAATVMCYEWLRREQRPSEPGGRS